MLAADNRRKTEELERARELQLAMLPRTRPRHPAFDVAFRMLTASEVGGDYYDFTEEDDGRLTVVVGDATGHGLHAGMVVAVAKSLFRTCGHHGSLKSILHSIAAGLESFHQRLAGMAMVLLRLEPGGCRFVSAGMPPLLVWRKTHGDVEELLVPAVPLATMSDPDYTEHQITLEPGDTILPCSSSLSDRGCSSSDATVGPSSGARITASDRHRLSAAPASSARPGIRASDRGPHHDWRTPLSSTVTSQPEAAVTESR